MTQSAVRATVSPPEAELDPILSGRVTLRIAGGWQIHGKLPAVEALDAQLEAETNLKSIGFDSAGLTAWDSGLVSYLTGLIDRCERRGIEVDQARFRKADLWLTMQEAGADALPIVSLVVFLVGLILGFIAEAQLAAFGAKIYVADLVGLAMVIQLGAVITAIVLAGRTGAAFAAQLGTMQVNEEIDALRTLGIAPMDFLVLPRLLALILMTPLLASYANLMGILGGAFVANVTGTSPSPNTSSRPSGPSAEITSSRVSSAPRCTGR